MKEKLIGDVAGHKNVRETVAIVIGESNSQAVAFSRRDAGGDADVFKCAVTAIVIQDVRDSGKFGGRAVHGTFVAAGFAVRHGPIDVASDEQIQVPVIVIIKKAGGDGPSARLDFRFGGDIRKCAVAIVVVENVFPEVGHIDIGKTVVVVVTDSHPHSVIAVVHIREPSLLGDIGEAAVLVLAVQTVPVGGIMAVEVRNPGQRIANMTCVHQKNVQQAVVVVIQQSDSARHSFDEVFPGGRRVVKDKINAFGG